MSATRSWVSLKSIQASAPRLRTSCFFSSPESDHEQGSNKNRQHQSIHRRGRGGRITDCDNAKTPVNGVLNGQMSESSASTWEDHPVAMLGLGVLDGTIDSDTLNRVCEIIQRLDNGRILGDRTAAHSTKNRSGVSAWDRIRDGGDV